VLRINRASLGKAAVLLLAGGGGTALYFQQSDINKQNENTVGLERRIDQMKSDHEASLARERQAREAQATNAAAQARVFGEKLQDAQNLADQTSAANRDLSDRLNENQRVVENMQTTIGELNQRLGTSIGMEQVMGMVGRVGPSAVNISYRNSEGNSVLGAGSIIRANGKRYLLTVGHGHSDVVHWLRQELTIRMFDGFSFKMTPTPLPGGTIPFLQSDTGDLALSELPPNIDAKIPENIGLEIRGPMQPPLYGEPIVVIGNPGGLNSSISIGFVRHPGRYVLLGDRLYANQTQVTELDGGNSGGPIISLRDGKLIGVSGWVRRGGYLPHGFGSNNVNITRLIDGAFKIPILTQEEKSHIGAMDFAGRFQMPTPLFPMPLGNFMPIANEPGQAANIRVIEPLSRFIMPTPLSTMPLANLIPKSEKKP